MARCFTLSRADQELVAARRRDSNRIGFAVQLALLRYPGIALAHLEQPIEPLVQWLAWQLAIPAAPFAGYARRLLSRSYGPVDGSPISIRMALLGTIWRQRCTEPHPGLSSRVDLGAIFVSLELSRSTWLVTSLSPGSGEKMSKHSVHGGDVAGLLERLAKLKAKAQARTGRTFPIIVIQEAGLDGFWIHRVLESEGIESHVVDAASILTSRRRRRAKTDCIDGETLVRTLLAHKRGEPRVCAMVRVPTPQEEDRRRVCRERKILVTERVEHVNRIKGLLFASCSTASFTHPESVCPPRDFSNGQSLFRCLC